MKLHLPNSAFLGNIDPFLRSFDPTHPDRLDITANKRWISIHPVVLAMVAARGLTIKRENIHLETLEAKSKHYLDRMGLFRMLGIESSMTITEHEPSGRFVPLMSISNAEELTHAITEVVPLLHLTPEQASPIKYVLSELVRNVLEHARARHGAIMCAQWYAKSNTIRVGIADAGIGIKKSINASYAVGSDNEAIRLALTPGITGTTRRIGGTEYNAGAGLFFIKSIAKVSRDFFMIYSGNTMYKLLKSSSAAKRIQLYDDPFKDRHSVAEDLPHWQGTVVGIDIALDARQEFSLLLDHIRGVYTKAVAEQKRTLRRRPQFI